MAECVICGYSCKILKKHLCSEHNLSEKEYYLSYVSETGVHPVCKNPNCNVELEFIKLSKPFGTFCSVHCRSSYTMTNMNKDSNFQAKAKQGWKTKVDNDSEFKQAHRKRAIDRLNTINNSEELKQKSFNALFSDINKVRERERKRLITRDEKANRTKRFIYLLEGSDFYKIGTTVNINKRVSDINRELNEDIKVLFAENVNNLLAINIESELVIALHEIDCIIENKTYFGKHETFEKHESLKTQVLEYLQTSTTIES